MAGIGGLLKSAGPLMALAKFGDSVKAAEVTPADLAKLAKSFNLQLDVEQVEKIAALVPQFVENAEETLTQFVMNGGLLRMVSGNTSGSSTSVIRCPHCSELIFV